MSDRDMSDQGPPHDALLIVSFGGPEKPAEVLPFLENVVRGKPVPRERLLEVAAHYEHFGGKSPLNDQLRALLIAVQAKLAAEGPRLPVYWGNRNWHPFLVDTLRQMADDGVRRALALFTSPYSSYSSCRQYRENVSEAQRVVGDRAPRVEKLRAYYNHPGFIEAMIAGVRSTLSSLPSDCLQSAPVLYTAHSIPLSMAANCQYAAQLSEACRLVTAGLGLDRWRLVYQSRSGSPAQPWLGPDIADALRELAASGAGHAVVVPIGFISDHMEVLYDLDTEARALCGELGISMLRAPTVGTHPRFVEMVRELVLERIDPTRPRPALGKFGASHDMCASDCCLPGPASGVKRSPSAAG
jgi:protoporphyrin/coproporphyrin ferrochelatase